MDDSCGQKGSTITQIEPTDVDRVRELATPTESDRTTQGDHPSESLLRIAEEHFDEWSAGRALVWYYPMLTGRRPSPEYLVVGAVWRGSDTTIDTLDTTFKSGLADARPMATTGSVTVDQETNEVTISDVTVHNAELTDYLSEYEPDEQAAVVERAVRIGVMTLQLADTSKDLEYVKREFEAMESSLRDELDEVQSALQDRFGDDGDVPQLLDEYLGEDGELQQALADAFGEDGHLTERLDAELGEDGEWIQATFDPDADTPMARLKAQPTEEIRSLRDKLSEEEGAAAERRRSPKKGEDFEDTVAGLLDELVYGTNDTVRHTGDEEGELPGRDVGDHVLTLGETGQRIVIESKSDQSYTQPTITDELDDALDNRAAEVAIFVSECESYIPNKVGYFQEFDKQRLAVSLCKDEDDEIDPGFLHIAMNWARMRAVEEYVDTSTDIDPESVQDRVKAVRDRVGQVSEVKTKCSSIAETAEEVKTGLDALRDDVTDELNQITAALSKEASPWQLRSSIGIY